MSVDGVVVISCWQHKLKYARGVLTYQDHLSRWQLNPLGKSLLTQHLSVAVERSLDVRLVHVKKKSACMTTSVAIQAQPYNLRSFLSQPIQLV